jgi:hypothetical protein
MACTLWSQCEGSSGATSSNCRFTCCTPNTITRISSLSRSSWHDQLVSWLFLNSQCQSVVTFRFPPTLGFRTDVWGGAPWETSAVFSGSYITNENSQLTILWFLTYSFHLWTEKVFLTTTMHNQSNFFTWKWMCSQIRFATTPSRSVDRCFNCPSKKFLISPRGGERHDFV